MKIFTISSLLILTFFTTLHSQELLYNTLSSINELNIDSCSTTSSINGVSYLDIAIAPNGIVYAIREDKLIQIDSNNVTNLINFDGEKGFNALTCSYENVLYTATNKGEIYSIDLDDLSIDSLMRIPYGSKGDITFYKGDLWLVTGGEEFIRIDLESKEYELIVDYTLLGVAYGFASHVCECNEVKGYFVQSVQIGESTSLLYEYSFDDSPPLESCIINTLQVNGLASKYEYLNSLDTIYPLRFDHIEIDTPYCNNNNGSINIELNGVYNGIGFELFMNDTLLENTEISGLSEGEYSFKVMDEKGCRDSITLTIPCKEVTSSTIDTPEVTTSFYPNPFNTYVHFENVKDPLKLKLFNLYGEDVTSKVTIDSSSERINFLNLGSGVYFIHYENKTYKLLKHF